VTDGATGPLRWGIAATGKIAASFATGLGQLDGAELVAVGSRSQERADAFGDRFGVAARHPSYEALAADPDVDVVYVASPHVRHRRDTLLFLRAGKHVLCEKPFAMNRAEGAHMVAAARERGLFLMEGLWSRFLPAYVELRRLLADGRIGEVRLVDADLGFRRAFDPAHRLFAAELGGGALLDVGIYPLQLVSMVLGAPDRVMGVADLGATGVDEQAAAVLHHPGGAIATVRAAVRTNLTSRARIVGSDGWVGVPAPMHGPKHLLVAGRGAGGAGGAGGGEAERVEVGYEGEGLRFEADEVRRCLAAGLTESPVAPLDETLSLLATLDAIRVDVGLTYPGESAPGRPADRSDWT
jgi:predicted dehydrogenase